MRILRIDNAPTYLGPPGSIVPYPDVAPPFFEMTGPIAQLVSAPGS